MEWTKIGENHESRHFLVCYASMVVVYTLLHFLVCYASMVVVYKP